MSANADLIEELRLLDFELYRVNSAWLLFVNCAKDFSDEQDAVASLVNRLRLREQFEVLKMALLQDCVAAICRTMDHAKGDTLTLQGAMGRANKLYGTTRKQDLKSISTKLGSVQTSAEMSSLRLFRDQSPARRGASLGARYEAFPFVADRASEVLGDLFSLCGVQRPISQATWTRQEEASRKFWDCFEKGLKAEEANGR